MWYTFHMDKYSVLENVFGYREFREGQDALIDAVLAGQDALGIMPTGAGKSLCYQIPALLFDGITLVVSPLISLMKDQVGALKQAGVAAAYLNSSLTAAQMARVLDNMQRGMYKLIYIAPERLQTPAFLDAVSQMQISFVAVDEAHCVSQWGQDFRPSYLEIARFLQKLNSRPPVSAFTATATSVVREDIGKLLELKAPFGITTGFDRKNLYFAVQSPMNRIEAVVRFVREKAGQSGIIYCLTRRDVEQICGLLQELDLPATRYHAGLDDWERRENQEKFQTDVCPVMVATNAFGMGIDKSNVSYVLHCGMPKNLESYYQEAGRAGRDGSPAQCVLFYSPRDIVTNNFLIRRDERQDDSLSPAQREQILARDEARLARMAEYCKTTRCLRRHILRYFGEDAKDNCGNCFSCTHTFEETDITEQAKQILSCVQETGERFGKQKIAEILRGKASDFSYCATYGTLSQLTKKQILEFLDALLDMDYLQIAVQNFFSIIQLGTRAADALTAGNPVLIRTPQRAQSEAEDKAAKREARKRQKEIQMQSADLALFSKLKACRTTLAEEQGVPAYVIFSDAALTEMSQVVPKTKEAFLAVNGVGEVKLAKYGAAFLEILQAHNAEPAPASDSMPAPIPTPLTPPATAAAQQSANSVADTLARLEQTLVQMDLRLRHLEENRGKDGDPL